MALRQIVPDLNTGEPPAADAAARESELQVEYVCVEPHFFDFAGVLLCCVPEVFHIHDTPV